MHRPLFAVLLLAVAPGQAAPRLTARLDKVSATELAQRLEAFYGLPVTFDVPRAGRTAAPPASRATFDFQEATLGQVIGEVERAFHVQAIGTGGAIRFLEADASSARLSLDLERVTVTLWQVRQTESRRKLVGAGNTEVDRSLQLTFVIRPRDGEPEAIQGITGTTILDARGGRSDAAAEMTKPTWIEPIPARPDERVVQVEFPAPRGGISGSMVVEGQVLLHHSARTYRATFTGPDAMTEPRQAGPVRIAARTSIGAEPRAIQFVFSWPATSHIDLGSRSGIYCFVRKEDGSVMPVVLSAAESVLNGDGGGSARVTATLPPGETQAGTLVWDVTVYDQQQQRVPFRFSHVVLPQAVSVTQPIPARPK